MSWNRTPPLMFFVGRPGFLLKFPESPLWLNTSQEEYIQSEGPSCVKHAVAPQLLWLCPLSAPSLPPPCPLCPQCQIFHSFLPKHIMPFKLQSYLLFLSLAAWGHGAIHPAPSVSCLLVTKPLLGQWVWGGEMGGLRHRCRGQRTPMSLCTQLQWSGIIYLHLR